MKKLSVRMLIMFCIFLSIVYIAGCGSSSSGSGDGDGDGDPVTEYILSGTAAAGRPIVGTVTVKDSTAPTAITKTTTILADGKYSVDVTGMTPPFMLRAEGTVGGVTCRYFSAATEADLGGTINITPFTDLIVANVVGQLAETYFNNGNFSGLTEDELEEQADALRDSLLPVLEEMGMEETIDLLRISFSADHSGFDAVMDLIKVEVDPETSIATIRNIVTKQEITDNLKTQDAIEKLDDTTGMDGVLTDVEELNLLAAKFNALIKTSLPDDPAKNANVLAVFSDTFLDNGDDLDSFFTVDMVGTVIGNLNILSMNGAHTNAEITFTYSGVDGESGTAVWYAVKKDGKWLLNGNQRIVQIDLNAYAEYRPNEPSNSKIKTGIFLGVRDNRSEIDSAVVTGPGIEGSIRLVPSDNDSWFRIENMWGGGYEPGDTAIEDIPDNAEYTFELYSGDDVIATYTEILPKRPYLQSELTTGSFPAISSQTLTAVQSFTTGNLQVTWTIPTGLTASSVGLYLSTVSTSTEEDVDLVGTETSKTISITPNFTPTNWQLNLSSRDTYDRKLRVIYWGNTNPDDDEFTLDPNYFGSWIASPTHHGCTYTSLVTFSNDGTYSGFENGGCVGDEYAFSTSGTWGMTVDGLMYMAPIPDQGSNGNVYTFFTSTGKLSMNDSDSSDVYQRDGAGTGLVGTWITEDEDDDCTETLIFTGTAFTYDKICTDPEDEEYMEGTYTVSGDVITVMVEGEVVDLPFFKIFNNSVLSLDYEDELYSDYTSDPNLLGSWFFDDQNMTSMITFSSDGGFYINEDVDVDDVIDPVEGYGKWEGDNGMLQIVFDAMFDGATDKTLYYYIVSSGDLLINDDYFVRTAGTTGLTGIWEDVDEACTDTVTFIGNGTYSSETACVNPDDNDSFQGTYAANDETILFDGGYQRPYHIFNDNQWLILSDYLYSKFDDDDDGTLLSCVDEALGLPSGTQPSSDQLESITILDCDGENISDISMAADMPHLQELKLNNNTISDLTPLSNLSELTRLELDSNLIEDLTPLEGLNNINYLSLSSNHISDLTPLQVLIGLGGLYLDNNVITDISPLSDLTNLSYLFLAENQITDIAPLQNMMQLYTLELGFNSISDISPLQNMTGLNNLVLSGNQIDDITGLSGLVDLSSLNLDFNQISDITPLQTLVNLQGLILSDNQITDITPLQGLSSLRGLKLDYNQITDISPLEDLTLLQHLRLSGNQIEDITILSGLTNLNFLYLDYNRISDVTPLSILTNLMWLDVSYNRISDLTPVEFVPNLEAYGQWADDDLVLLASLLGTWTSSYSDWDESTDSTTDKTTVYDFLDDGTLSYSHTETDQETGLSGVSMSTGNWGVDDENILHVMLSEGQGESLYYYFIRNDGRLALDDRPLHRIGDGNDIHGTWATDGSSDDCPVTVVFNINETYSVTELCPGDDVVDYYETGTYSVSGDIISMTSDEEDEPWDNVFYLVDESTLLIGPLDHLYTR